MNQTWENDEKPNFKPHFGPNFFFLCVGFTITSSQTLFQAIILYYFQENWWTKFQKMVKNLILAQTWVPKIFFVDFTSASS